MEISSVYADYEIRAKVMNALHDVPSVDVWIELSVRHVVSGEIVFAHNGPYMCRDGGAISSKQALYSALRQAERILARKINREPPSETA